MTPQERNLVYLVLSVVVSGALILLLAKPQLAAYHSQALAVAARKIENQELINRQAELKKLSATIKQHQAEIDRLGYAVPSDQQFPELISQLSSIATAAQVNLSSIQPLRTSEEETLFKATMTLRGSYEAMTGFVERLQNNLRPMVIRSFSLVDTSDGQAADQLNATLQVEIARVPGK